MSDTDLDPLDARRAAAQAKHRKALDEFFAVVREAAAAWRCPCPIPDCALNSDPPVHGEVRAIDIHASALHGASPIAYEAVNTTLFYQRDWRGLETIQRASHRALAMLMLLGWGDE